MIVLRAMNMSLLAALLFTTSCASNVSQPTGERTVPKSTVVTQDQARQMAYSYRQQAQDLRDLARRLETEALFSSGQSSTDSKASMLQMQKVLAAADDADELAREYRRQVPHGQLQ